MKLSLYLFLFSLTLSSCALFKRNRVLKNKELEKTEAGFNTFYYPSKIEDSKTLVVFFSGDGGWLDFDAELCKKLAANGLKTLGINSRSYFWKERTPRATSKHLRELIRTYDHKINNIYLIGYSFGADITPFVYTGLPFFMKMRVKKLVLLSPFATTDFEVHLSDLMGSNADDYKYNVRDEVARIKIPIYCFYGEGEEKALDNITQKNFNLKILKGNHHYETQESQKIIQAIIEKSNQKDET
ncbi:type IV secretory pathway VirJ component [Pedobacter sp. UYP30]|uniref:AcvB/VirJ family lysyl-phosphatidylglycerol hydrolase n=1 Tax=Pedobacter sp. UYP30 TaxID=1756400 RepID=UPI003399EA66